MAASTCIEAVETLCGLDVQELALVRGERLVLRGLSFHVAPGGMLAIEGRNGAGKTSLLRAIAGFLEPRSGTILLPLANGNALAIGEERRVFVGWLGHQDGVKLQLTPTEHLRFYSQVHRTAGDIGEALVHAGLAPLRDLPVQYLSAGQRRRLALARLILVRRPLWLLDEPLSGLDPEGKALMRQAMERHCAASGIVVAATHEPLGANCATLNIS